MKVAIIGAGAIAKGYAAYLSNREHDVTIWSPSGRPLGEIISTGRLRSSGLIDGTFPVTAAASAEEAVAGAEVVPLALPANGHAFAIDAICPHVKDGQTIIVSAQLSLSALLLTEKLRARDVNVSVAAWATTVLAAKSTGPD